MTPLHFTQIWFVICMASFTWAFFFYFKQPKKKDTFGKLLSLVAGVTTFVHTYRVLTTEADFKFQFITLGFYALSLTLFTSAIMTARSAKLPFIFSKSLPSKIVSSGPYRVFTHPFYVSYSICWVSTTLLSPTLDVFVTTAAILVMYVLAARQEKRMLLKSNLGLMYRAYLNRSMFAKQPTATRARSKRTTTRRAA